MKLMIDTSPLPAWLKRCKNLYIGDAQNAPKPRLAMEQKCHVSLNHNESETLHEPDRQSSLEESDWHNHGLIMPCKVLINCVQQIAVNPLPRARWPIGTLGAPAARKKERKNWLVVSNIAFIRSSPKKSENARKKHL